MSIRETILAATSQFQVRAIELPELGIAAFVRPLSLAGLSRFQATLAKDPARGPLIMLIDCLCDDTGKRLFTAADEAALAELPSAVAQKLVETISEASALTPTVVASAPGNS